MIRQSTNEQKYLMLKYWRHHIDLVRRISLYVFDSEFIMHDHDKLVCSDEELNLWAIRRLKLNNEIELSDEESKSIDQLVFNHVKINAHHPPFWDDNFRSMNDVTNATKMDEIALLEMCCDWSALAIKNKDGFFDFYNENVLSDSPKFIFNEYQRELIENYLNQIEKYYQAYPDRLEWR